MKKTVTASLIVVIGLALVVGCAGCTSSTSPSPSPSTSIAAVSTAPVVSNTTALGTSIGNATAFGNATHLDVMLGQNFTVQLQSNPSTGYQWQPTYNTTSVKLVNQTYMAGAALPGAPGAEVFTFQGLKAGTSAAMFNYVSPANQTTISVTYTIDCTTLSIPSVNAVYVANGSNFTIQQLSNPSTGYQWRLDYSNDTIKLIAQAFVSNTTSTNLVGAGGTQRWTFQATAAGSAGIVLSEISPAKQITTTVPYLVLVTS